MTTHTQVMPLAKSKYQLVFPPSKLATWYCKGVGIEIGAAAHNPFYLEGCQNVTDAEGFEFYKAAQVEMCGSYANADVFSDAAMLDFDDNSLDYVVSSHMLEHHPDPIGCLLEWVRVVRDGGCIFTIVPKRNAHPLDEGRPISVITEMIEAWENHATVETAAPAINGGKGGHYWVFDLDLITSMVNAANSFMTDKKLVMEQLLETDDKVGNGHLFILSVNSEAPEEEAVQTPVAEEALATAGATDPVKKARRKTAK